LDGKNVLNRHNSAADYSISLKFRTDFGHGFWSRNTWCIQQMLKVKGSKVKVTAWH